MASETLSEVALEASLRGDSAASSLAEGGAVPTVDLHQPAEVCAREMWDAAHSIGFFSVVNHDIPQRLIDAAFEASAGFFSLPLEAKAAASPFAAHLNSGHEYFSQIRPSTGTPDQKESLQITARTGAMEGRWPAEPAGFEATARELLEAAHALAARILTLLEPLACPHLAPGTLAASHTLWAEDGQCTLRMLHYPPTAPPPAAPAGDAQLWRAGPHTDWDCVTLLFQREGQAGLECAPNPRAKQQGPWLRVDPVAGGVAVNIGDMLARWSDGRLLSNLHRVRMPREASEWCKPRYSLAFFMQADKHCALECETQPTITAGDYILGRIKSNFSANFEKAAEQERPRSSSGTGAP